ncbi:bifunctional sugar-1-phosphate nucleotidylyltransferase/acetyltransferase [Haladaptatus sp. DJG-WS-42]|uniref:bifunctional sugar-1-phosphate nucleotidylyltransferase/acetyltransferase n=1 Tax=Haladaptatus sp. DJG-WS-42 TaxID=3120516 RepID=UPI0030D297AF
MGVRTAVVLAAGEGTRLHPLTRNRPKPMLPAANRPVMAYVFDALIDAGIEQIHVVVGYKRDRVQEYFGHSYRNVPLSYHVQEKQLGSGHALLQAQEAVTESMIVVNGDRALEPGIVKDVMDAYEQYGTPALAVLERDHPNRYGTVVLDGGRIQQLVEKPDVAISRLINAGVYAFDASIFDAIDQTPREDGELALTTTISRLIDEGTVVRGVRTEGMWVDATYPWDILHMNRELLARGRVEEPSEDGEVWVADSALVHEDATLLGPVVIGPDCVVGPGSVIGPNVALGRNVTIGANATVEQSVIDADTRVGPGSVLIDCVTGQDVHLGASTIVPGGPADVRINAHVYQDQELGAVFADRVRAEGAISVAPGTLVGSGAHLHTGVQISGYIVEGAEVMR